MIDLSKRILQNTISVHGTEYWIKTDFRLWLSFGRLMREKPNLTDFDYLYEFDGIEPKAPFDRQGGIEELIKFFNPGQSLPRPCKDGDAKVIDFRQDSDLIFAAFMECYGINLLKADLHWHEFLALLKGLHGTKMNEVMGYRSFDENDKTGYTECMKELRTSWELEPELTEKERKNLEEFNEAFG